eukprot:jgi/Chrpa1/25902/Chrysochromulina_OHIO_Genome00011899-RA
MASVSELTTLEDPTEASLSHVLKQRLLAGDIYTGMSAVLLAVNPCEQLLELYSEETLERHLCSQPDMPPHVFRTAAGVHRGMLQGRSQSVIISGESGAGKTETFKRVMQFISAAVARTGPRGRQRASSGRGIEQLLVETVPILESYGNASTVHNPDSSRFGKFVLLHFTEHGALVDVAVKTYLLETTRVVRLGANERSFHVFYELLAGGHAQARARAAAAVDLDGEDGSPKTPLTPRTVQRAFLSSAMAAVDAQWGESPDGSLGADALAKRKLPPPANNAACKENAVAATPVKPQPPARSGRAKAGSPLEYLVGFDLLAELQLEPLPMSRFLPAATCQTKVQRNDSSKFEALLRALDAADVPPPEARELWRATAGCVHLGAIEFTQIGDEGTLTAVTAATLPALQTSAVLLGCEPAALHRALTIKQIKVLDDWIEKPNPPAACRELCAGLAKATYAKLFEWLQTQLSAALASHNPLASEATAAAALGQDSNAVECPQGVFALIEEQCTVPKGSDAGLHINLTKYGKGHAAFRPNPKGSAHLAFTLAHYAAEVTYDTDGFLEKNRDRCPEDLLVLLRTSRTELLRVAFAPTPAEQATMSCKRGARFSGIVAKFAHQLGELNAHLKASEIHFIRCIKPNAKLQPRLFDDAKVRAQIKCNCIVDACLIMKAGFPERLLFGHVINTYGCLAPTEAIAARKARAAALRVQPIGGDGGAGSVEAAGAEEVAVRAEKQACSALMLAARLNADAWAVGNTRLCLKDPSSSPTKGSPSAQMLAHAPGSAYANAANGFVPGDAAWYVTRAGHVRAVRVLCAAASIFAAATAADGSDAAKDGVAFVAERYAVEYLSGAGGPFVADAACVFRAPPSAEELARALEYAASSGVAFSQEDSAAAKSQQEFDAEKLARSRARRLEKLKLLHEQVARNWTLWHPACRPATAHPLLQTPAGFEEVPAAILEYGHYLGMAFPEDGQFLWIAEAGAAAPLPEGWSLCRDPEGLTYFHEPATSVASRQHPSDERFRHLYYQHKYGGVAGTGPAGSTGGTGPAGASGDEVSAEGQVSAEGVADASGSYLSMLIGQVKSRHVADALKNLPRKELEGYASLFGRYDPNQSGRITLGSFLKQWQGHFSASQLRVMFESYDLTGTAEVDFNEFAKEIEQRRAGAEKDKGKRREARTSDDRPAAPLGGADTYSDAHQIARQLAPTIPVQRHSDDVELATAVLSVVGNAIRDRIRGKPRVAKGKEADGAPTADAGGKKRSKKKGKKGSSPKSSSRPGSGERGGGGAAGSSGDHLPASASADHLPRAAREAEVRRVLSDVLASLAGYDTRLALPLFAQQLQMLNRRFGQPSDPAQIEALFGVAQRGGCVEMAEFLRRESTVHYFCLDLHSA